MSISSDVVYPSKAAAEAETLSDAAPDSDPRQSSSIFRPYIIGVDPGLTGAVAVYCITTKRLQAMLDMPVTPKRENRKVQIEPYKLAEFIDRYAIDTALAVIEDVGPRPGEGVVSVARFAFVTGVVHGVVAACGIPIFKTPPAVWKSLSGLNDNKDQSRHVAIAKFPAAREWFAMKQHHGRAEAALLARFGERLLPQTQK